MTRRRLSPRERRQRRPPATAWLAQGSSLQMIQRVLGHADSRSTERYAKLGDLALVDVIRLRARRNVDPIWIQSPRRPVDTWRTVALVEREEDRAPCPPDFGRRVVPG